MVLSFSTNPYNNYYAANSKEFISLDKAAKQDIRPETRYDLLPGNADSFAADLEKYSKQFGYGFLLNIPTMRQIDATDANVLIYSNQIHMLETWNQVTDARIAINANEASIAPGVNRETVFLADWSGDRLALGGNRLGRGLKPFERR